ncbi:MFS general substrate transporter, partial [Mycena latifolia]
FRAQLTALQRSIIFLPGVLVGRLVDLGHFRIPFAAGSILIVVGTFLVSLCKVYWHFILCQGFMIGTGTCLTYGTSAIVVTHWWKRRRGLAFGIAAAGGALGGTFFPIVMRQLLDDLGFTWTCRIMGFLHIVTLIIANLCLARRLPPRKALGGLFGFHVFRRPAFAVYSLAYLFSPLGTFTGKSCCHFPLSHLKFLAVLAGLSRNFAFYLVAIHNGAGGLAGPLWGLYGDHLGAMNVLIQAKLGLAAVTIAWPFCHSVASLSAISVLYGLTASAFTTLGQVPVAAMGGTEDLGRRIGTMNTILGIGTLCGPPLGGLLANASLGYKAVGYFGGGMLLLGDALFTLARFLAVPKFWCKF